MPEPETVFVAVGDTSSGPRKVHTDEDCYRLKSAAKIDEKALACYPPAFREWCCNCGPGEDNAAPESKATRGGTA